jgi:hypothetical protein
MKYLCLIAAEQQRMMEYLSEEDAASHFEEYREFLDDIRESGHYVGCNRLSPPNTALTVRMRNGKVVTTDGPFVETKEQLGGYFVIEAKDMNEAIQIAARIPGARFGCVEVRPIAEDAQTMEALGFDKVASQPSEF